MENTETKKTPQEEMGSRLKAIREANNWTIHEVSELFHITEYSLTKIEAGKKDKSKTAYYNRLYIIRFLKRVNEYNEENKALLEEAYPNNIEDSIRKSSSMDYAIGSANIYNSNKKSRVKNNKNRILNILALILILIIIGVSAFYTSKMLQSRTEKATENPTALLESTKLSPEKVVAAKAPEEKETSVKAGAVKNNAQTITIKDLANKDKYKLDMTFKADSYVDITDMKTNKALSPGKLYKKGDKLSITVKNKNDIKINLGYAAAATISIDGKKIDASDYPKDQIFVTIKNEAK